MVLSNAERQARHRKNLKARADAAAQGAAPREIVDQAIGAIWSHFQNPIFAESEIFPTVDVFAQAFKGDPEGLARAARSVLEDEEHAVPADDRKVISLALPIFEAALLDHVAAPKRGAPKSR